MHIAFKDMDGSGGHRPGNRAVYYQGKIHHVIIDYLGKVEWQILFTPGELVGKLNMAGGGGGGNWYLPCKRFRAFFFMRSWRIYQVCRQSPLGGIRERLLTSRLIALFILLVGATVIAPVNLHKD